MAEAEEVMKTTTLEILERGEIYFFYRPKVGKEEAGSADDVQRIYIVLTPLSHAHEVEKDKLLRFIVMGRKSLPDPSKRGRPYWGFVEFVTTNTEDVKSALKGGEYETASKGHRESSGARALGEGVYRILKHGQKEHTHLIYRLQLPPEGENSEPQESLNVEREASFLIQVKNPEVGKAAFPGHLQDKFGKLRYHGADPPDYLNYQGCEFLLISASDDVEQELGLDLDYDGEGCSHSHLIQTFGETASTDALLRGTWV